MLAICPLVLLPFLALDAFLYGDSKLFWCLVITRVFLLAASLLLIVWLRRTDGVADFDVVLVTWSALFLGADLFLVATRPPSYPAHLAAHTLVVLVLFVGLPLNLHTQTRLAGVWSVGYLAVLGWVVRPGGGGFWPVAVTGLALCWLFGFSAARRRHHDRRGLHAALEEIERLRSRAERDEVFDRLTGLHNRQGWNRRLHEEESRFKRHGGSACVLAVDLHGLWGANETEGPEGGDALLRRAAQALQRVVREPDLVARVADCEFLVLGVGCGANGGDALADRIRESFEQSKIEATVSHSVRDHGRDLRGAWREAEQAMKERRRVRRAPRAAPPN